MTLSHEGVALPVNLSHAPGHTVALSQAGVVLPVTLSHAGVVHHEEIHFEVVCAGPLDLVVL